MRLLLIKLNTRIKAEIVPLIFIHKIKFLSANFYSIILSKLICKYFKGKESDFSSLVIYFCYDLL